MKEYHFSVGESTPTNAYRRLIGFLHACGFRQGDFKIPRFEDNGFVVEAKDEDTMAEVLVLWDNFLDHPKLFAGDQGLITLFTANPLRW